MLTNFSYIFLTTFVIIQLAKFGLCADTPVASAVGVDVSGSTSTVVDDLKVVEVVAEKDEDNFIVSTTETSQILNENLNEDSLPLPTTTDASSQILEEDDVRRLANSSNAEENAIQYYLNQHQPFEGVDTWEAPFEIRKNFPYYLSGYDAENRPIWVIEGGRWNLRNVVEQGQETMDLFEKFARQGFYRARKAIKEKSTPDFPVEDDIVLVDFDGLDLLQVAHVPSVSFLLHLAQKIRQDVQDTLYQGIVVNTNSVALSLINVARPILGPIIAKAQIFGTNSAKWKPHVLKLCPRDQIPEWYGGTSKNFVPVQIYG